jgi:hypothetical protein
VLALALVPDDHKNGVVRMAHTPMLASQQESLLHHWTGSSALPDKPPVTVAHLTIFVIQFAKSLACFLYPFDYRSRTLSSTIRTLAGEQRCLLGDRAKRAHFLFTN